MTIPASSQSFEQGDLLTAERLQGERQESVAELVARRLVLGFRQTEKRGKAPALAFLFLLLEYLKLALTDEAEILRGDQFAASRLTPK